MLVDKQSPRALDVAVVPVHPAPRLGGSPRSVGPPLGPSQRASKATTSIRGTPSPVARCERGVRSLS